jgi:hypothetical protein
MHVGAHFHSMCMCKRAGLTAGMCERRFACFKISNPAMCKGKIALIIIRLAASEIGCGRI